MEARHGGRAFISPGRSSDMGGSERHPGSTLMRWIISLEPMLVLSGLIAVVGLVLWWFFVAESSNPSGPLQPI